MNLSFLDIAIILVYLLATVVIGFLVKKQASKNIKKYFLRGNTLPCYMLGFPMAMI
jgi:solute:Na+ symporter, SSS family